jgi:hypothetical protein
LFFLSFQLSTRFFQIGFPYSSFISSQNHRERRLAKKIFKKRIKTINMIFRKIKVTNHYPLWKRYWYV